VATGYIDTWSLAGASSRIVALRRIAARLRFDAWVRGPASALLYAIPARSRDRYELALAWALRDERVTSLVIGASRVSQIEDNVAALANTSFTDEELRTIDEHSVGITDVDLWAGARAGQVS
jgi:L-glyceraldehyde 3-phosphate reductase